MKRNDDSRLLMLLLVGLFGALLAGCSPKSPEVSYYSLFTTGAVKPGMTKDTTTVLAIGPVTAPDILRRSQIATGSGAGRYRLSDYHRWAGDVEKDFARALAELLGSRPGGGQVVLYPGVGESTCRLTVDILAMEGDLGQEARLAVSWSLLDSKQQSTAVVRRSDFSRQPEDAGYDAWVRAQQANLKEFGEEIGATLDRGSCRGWSVSGQ